MLPTFDLSEETIYDAVKQFAGNQLPPKSATVGTKCPPIDPAVYQGLVGDVVRTIEPYTEAHPIAILASLLTAFGNIVGPGPHTKIEETRHPSRLFVALVGPTGLGRKGQSFSTLGKVLGDVDPDWIAGHVSSGLQSGEALIRIMEGDGKVCLIREEEFGKLLTAKAREGATLSHYIRNAWDGAKLENNTKHNPMAATNHHLGLIVHITPEELQSNLTETDQSNGFANRFLWLYVERSKEIAEPYSVPAALLDPIVMRLQDAVSWAKQQTIFERSAEASMLWRKFYPTTFKVRKFAPFLDRAAAYVNRIALTYALLSQSPKIEQEHLKAALALWRYNEASLRLIFGNTTGNTNADKVMEVLQEEKELSRTGIRRKVFAGHIKPVELDRVRDLLDDLGLVVISATGGGELWTLAPDPLTVGDETC